MALLAACAAPPVPKPAPPEAVGAYDAWRIPDRFNLPPNEAALDADAQAAAAAMDGAALLAVIRDPKAPHRMEAVVALANRTSQVDRGAAPYTWQFIADGAEALDELLAHGSPPAFRRWAVYTLFTEQSSEVRGRITLDPSDRAVDGWREKFEAIRALVRRDQDPLLAEFFERYEQDPEAPRWREAKAAALAARDRMVAARPEFKKDLDHAMDLGKSIESAQLEVLRRLHVNLDSMKGLTPARRAKLKAVETSWVDHRLRITWANIVPRVASDAVGAEEARTYGFVAVPVRTGWPAVPPRP